MAEALVLKHITKTFPHPSTPVRAVDDVTLTVNENEFFALLGPSGCGKSSLLRLVAGLEQADAGEILLSGQDITSLPANKRPVNTVFQSYALFPHLTVADNVAFGLRMQGKSNIGGAVIDALKLVQMESLADRMPAQLSGGQQQRVALARALVNRPKLVLLDESLSALDYKLRREMQGELKRLQRETGITFILVTHDQDEALSMADRVAVMDKGKIAQVATPPEIYHRPASRYVAGFVGLCNFVPATALGISEPGEVGFRPEDVSFRTSGIAGQVTQIAYRGPVTHYIIQLDSGEEIIVASPRNDAAVPGARVNVNIDRGRLIRCAT
ncbi:MAG TPA: ABC transporter ATP-binding protein [Patescibacteria group bacterium]|nr:ABC transporter ATP-binding protein [Patescibacteria group bacterium]